MSNLWDSEQNENMGPLTEKYEDFEDDSSRPLNQVWGSSECRVPGDYLDLQDHDDSLDTEKAYHL